MVDAEFTVCLMVTTSSHSRAERLATVLDNKAKELCEEHDEHQDAWTTEVSETLSMRYCGDLQ